MGAPRKFDHDEARRRAAAGQAYASIARALGVSDTAIRRVCIPDVGKRMAAAAIKYQNGVETCPQCGGQRKRQARYQGHAGCRSCGMGPLTTSVRADSLRCVSCREWKPDDDFSPRLNAIRRRQKHSECKKCTAERKRRVRAQVRPVQTS